MIAMCEKAAGAAYRGPASGWKMMIKETVDCRAVHTHAHNEPGIVFSLSLALVSLVARLFFPLSVVHQKFVISAVSLMEAAIS